MKRDRKEPLYRKINKRALHHYYDVGGDFRHERNTKEMQDFEGTHKGMGGTKKRGLDYTPLYMFLLSRVGEPWAPTYQEAQSRLDTEEPIWRMVHHTKDHSAIVRMGESSMFSALFVDSDGILQKIDPDAPIPRASCNCCTHTFNGKPALPYKTPDTLAETINDRGRTIKL